MEIITSHCGMNDCQPNHASHFPHTRIYVFIVTILFCRDMFSPFSDSHHIQVHDVQVGQLLYCWQALYSRHSELGLWASKRGAIFTQSKKKSILDRMCVSVCVMTREIEKARAGRDTP